VTWLLLVYTVPSEPSRKRATIWRALKKEGAIYLRDGVAVLPERPETLGALRDIAAQVDEFGGRATLIEGARLDPKRHEEVVAQARASRAEEYAEIIREGERFLAHAAAERAHRTFASSELDAMAVDLGKLRRWAEQIRGRDHFAAEDAATVGGLLARCERAVAAFVEEAREQSEGALS
jgi:hypothetical protein